MADLYRAARCPAPDAAAAPATAGHAGEMASAMTRPVPTERASKHCVALFAKAELEPMAAPGSGAEIAVQ